MGVDWEKQKNCYTQSELSAKGWGRENLLLGPEQPCLKDQRIPCSGAQGPEQKVEWEQIVKGRELCLSTSIVKREAETQSLAVPPLPSTQNSPYTSRPSTVEPQGIYTPVLKHKPWQLPQTSSGTEGN